MPGFGWLEIHAVDHCNNTCEFCNNCSPYVKKKEYSAEDYIPWLDKLIEKNIKFYCISVLGGEPFLHKDLLGFTMPLRKYEHSLMLTTNGFWLSQKNIEKYSKLFDLIDIICFSIYPNIAQKVGGVEKMKNMIEKIRSRHANLRVDVREISFFSKFEFLRTPILVDRFCEMSDCVALLSDGRLSRCNLGAYAHMHPEVTKEFLHAKHMFYNLNTDTDDFWMWRKRWPMEACSFCTGFKSRMADWKYMKRIPPRIQS